MALKGKIKFAIATDILTSLTKIPRNQQHKVLGFINKFQANPASPGINYEKIVKAKDPNLRSVRIDKTYRGIVLKPETGNLYVLLWVDHHDKAYEWAERKVCRVHPETGSIQVFNMDEDRTELGETKTDQTDAPLLFGHIRDRELIRLGVPEMLLPLVRGLKSEEELDQAADQFPEEAYESLFFLAQGHSFKEVYSDMERAGRTPSYKVDTDDYETALNTPDSRGRFYVVEDELELAAILNAPLEKWRVFLHPSQLSLAERDWNGPVRALGGAGTGKTVVAMHRAKWLARHHFNRDTDRILFTTFTKNLAADIRENLTHICTNEEMRRIEVVNLDKWVSVFLRRNGYSYEIDYGMRTDPLWKAALDMAPSQPAPSFYREEWIRVIQPQGITSVAEYMKASRVGRGTRLNRKDRKAVWSVFEEYRVLLNEQNLKESDDAMRDARLLLMRKKDILPYKSVIVDEAQDMSMQAFRLIREIVGKHGPKNDIFIAGDAHQRIYQHKVVLSQCGINIRGRSRKLRINYRTTDETRSWAVNLLKDVETDDLNGGPDDQKGYKSLLHGELPGVHHFDTFQEELDFIIRYLKRISAGEGSLKNVCLAVRTNHLMKQYESALVGEGIPVYRIRRSKADERRAEGVRLATMHRVKGIEFDRIIIASVNDGVIPYDGGENDSPDQVVRRESEVRERALLYVAATRARKEVVVTSFGKSSRFLLSD